MAPLQIITNPRTYSIVLAQNLEGFLHNEPHFATLGRRSPSGAEGPARAHCSSFGPALGQHDLWQTIDSESVYFIMIRAPRCDYCHYCSSHIFSALRKPRALHRLSSCTVAVAASQFLKEILLASLWKTKTPRSPT